MNKNKGQALIYLGLLLILGAVLLTLFNRYDSERAGEEAAQVLEQLQTVLRDDPLPAPELPASSPAPEPDSSAAPPRDHTPTKTPTSEESQELPEMLTVQIGQWSYIGTLDLPSLGLSLPVMAKWDYTRLQVSPCRYAGSVYSKDLVICGHNYATHFSPVRGIEPGAEVIFTDMSGTVYRYTVSYTETVEPTAIEQMITPDGAWDLTLFTCNIGGRTRFAARCTLQSVTPPETGEKNTEK